MIVAFYAGSSPACLAVRWDTQRPHQPFADMPSHCALILGDTLYEFVASGWHAREAVAADYAWTVHLPGLNEEAARRFADGCRGERYGWGTILAIALARLIPDRWLSEAHIRGKHICSWFVLQALSRAGWQEPPWLKQQYCPACPNDVWLAVRETSRQPARQTSRQPALPT